MPKKITSSKKKIKKPGLQMELAIGGAGLAQKALFAQNLSVMLKAGLTIVESLEIAVESSTGKMKKALYSVLHSVQSGRPLSESFADHPKIFSGLFVSATYAGESSGTLEENMANVAEQLRKEKELTAKVKGAMLYPIVVLVAAFFMGLAVAFLVLPKITPLFEGLKVDLPLTTRWLISFSHFIQNHGTAFFFSIIVLVILFIWLVRQKFSHPVTHWLLLNVPIIKPIVKNSNLVRFSRTLGTLLKSGLNIDEALEITKNGTGNFYYKRAISQVSKRATKGIKVSSNLDYFPKLFPMMSRRMIKVGEESGKLDESLLYLANYYEVEVDTSTKALSTAIEPILLIFIGLGVGFLALSIITPIYNITGNIQR